MLVNNKSSSGLSAEMRFRAFPLTEQTRALLKTGYSSPVSSQMVSFADVGRCEASVLNLDGFVTSYKFLKGTLMN